MASIVEGAGIQFIMFILCNLHLAALLTQIDILYTIPPPKLVVIRLSQVLITLGKSTQFNLNVAILFQKMPLWPKIREIFDKK